MHDLKVWADIEADGRVSTTTTTPGKTPGKEDQMSRLSKVNTHLCRFIVKEVTVKWV